MRIAVIGATGWLGGMVAAEARERGHEVTALVRDPVRAATLPEGVDHEVANVMDSAAVAAAIRDSDAVVGAVRAPRETPEQMPAAARSVIAAMADAGVKRVVWIGGTGTLRVTDDGPRIVDLPEFPDEWKGPTLAHSDALQLFRGSDGLDWTYVAVPREIVDGERTGAYRVGGDVMLSNDNGVSRITAPDFAVAVLDMLERGTHACEHVTVAY